MSFLIVLALFLILNYTIKKNNILVRTGVKKEVWILVFTIKVLSGFLAILLYRYYYKSADIFYYFEEAHVFNNLFLNQQELFWKTLIQDLIPATREQSSVWSQNTAFNFLLSEKQSIVMVHFLISFISMGNIYVHSLLMAFISFCGQVALFRFVQKQVNLPNYWIILAVFLLPSSLFWTSSLFKEPFGILSLGFTLYFTDKLLKNFRWNYLLACFIFVFIGLITRPFIIIAALFPLFYFVLYKRYKELKFVRQSLAVSIGIVLISISLYFLKGSPFDILQKISTKQEAFITLQEDREIGSLIEVERVYPSISSFILNIPKAIARVLFRPGIYDYRGILYIPDILQNLALLFLVFLALNKFKPVAKEQMPFMWFSILYIIISYAVIGLSCNILGAIVKYKVIALPFSFLFILSIIDPEKMSSFSEKIESKIEA